MNIYKKKLINNSLRLNSIANYFIELTDKNDFIELHKFIKNKNFSFLVEEKDLNDKLLNLLNEIYGNMSKLDEISANQRQYSDKHVYENIDKVLDKILNEKN